MKHNNSIVYLVIFLGIFSAILLFIVLSQYNEINNLEWSESQLEVSLSDKDKEIDSLNVELTQLKDNLIDRNSELSKTQIEYNSYQKNMEETLDTALLPPYISVDNQIIYVVFKLSDGDILTWNVPFSTLDYDLRRGYFRREYVNNELIPLHHKYAELINEIQVNYANNNIELCNNYQDYANQDVGCSDLRDFYQEDIDSTLDTFNNNLDDLKEEGVTTVTLDNKKGKDFVVMDFRPYVDESYFEDVVTDMYNSYTSDDEFIYDVWYMTSRLTTYSSDIEETPKYPLETLLSGGGDCEDTSILVASILKAVPKNWDVELVYLDSDNPTNPKNINHVMVYVDTGHSKYFIETTSDDEMNPYGEVDGYYFEV